jgi:hypothetical protein
MCGFLYSQKDEIDEREKKDSEWGFRQGGKMEQKRLELRIAK